MPTQIIWTKTALEDLEGIEHYIFADNPFAAQETVTKILETKDMLHAHPELGKPGRVFGTRELQVPRLPYIIVYAQQGQRIEIWRVIHIKMKW